MKKTTQSKLRSLIERIIREETESPTDLMSIAKKWVSLVQRGNDSSDPEMNKLGNILYRAGILDRNPNYSGTRDTLYQWFGLKKNLSGSKRKVAKYIQMNIE